MNHSITTFKVLFTGPDDEEGTILFDKATLQIAEGDAVQFWYFGVNLKDKTEVLWFEAGDVLTFVQEPYFQYNFLWFHDAGRLIEHHYAILAADVAKNFTLSDPIPSPRVMDSPFGNMLVYEGPSGYFNVQVPWDWIELVPDSSQDEVFKASTSDGSGSASMYVEEGALVSLTEYIDEAETAFLEAGAEAIVKTNIPTAQGHPATILEWSIAGSTT